MINKTRYATSTRPSGSGKDKEALSIIILAATAGYRMKSLGPKPLLKDKYQKTIIENQAEIFKLYLPNSEIILVGGFEIDKIVKNKPNYVRLVENQLYESTNDIEELRLGLNNCLHKTVLVTYGDLYFNQAFIRDFSSKESTIVIDNKESMLADDLGVTVVDNYATILSYGIATPKWCRLVLFKNQEAELLRQFVLDRNNSRMYVFEAINWILEKGGQFKVQCTANSHNVIHIDSSKELSRIQ